MTEQALIAQAVEIAEAVLARGAKTERERILAMIQEQARKAWDADLLPQHFALYELYKKILETP